VDILGRGKQIVARDKIRPVHEEPSKVEDGESEVSWSCYGEDQEKERKKILNFPQEKARVC